MMPSISLCMIVKNEELVIERCLQSIAPYVDEIILVDTGSVDQTKELARRYTTNIYDFAWIDDFSAARNESFAKATKDYILWLDADDVLLPDDQKKFQELKETLTTDVDLVVMKYHVALDNAGNPTLTYNRERLFKRSVGYRWSGQVHEAISMYGTIQYSDIAITHKKVKPADANRNLNIFESMIASEKCLDAREQFYYARELMYHERTEEAIAMFEQCLERTDGWFENKISACKDLSHCYLRNKTEDLALQTLLRSFLYDKPRAELCCDIGKIFLDRRQYEQAIFWYELCLQLEYKECSGGFQELDCYQYIPCMQLCVCYDRLGNHVKAMEYNERAGAVKPYDDNYQYNKRYFEQLFETLK